MVLEKDARLARGGVRVERRVVLDEGVQLVEGR